MLSAAVLLPLPDSPTSAVAEPGLDVQVDAAHGRHGAAAGVVDGVEVLRRRACGYRRVVGSLCTRSQSPIMFVASTVRLRAMPGHRRQPPACRQKCLRPVGQHPAPRRRRRRHAEAEEAQRALGDDRQAELQAEQHEQRRHDVRQDVAADRPSGRCRPSSGPGHEVLRLEAQHLAAQHAGVARPAGDGQDDDRRSACSARRCRR